MDSKTMVIDHPVEDSLGNEIASGDTYIIDRAGNVIRFDLEVLEDYLLEVHNVKFYEAK